MEESMPKPANVSTFSKPNVAYQTAQPTPMSGDEVAGRDPRIRESVQMAMANRQKEYEKRNAAMQRVEGRQEDPYIYRNMPQGLSVQAPVRTVGPAPRPLTKEEIAWERQEETKRSFDKAENIKQHEQTKAAIQALRGQLDQKGLLDQEKKREEEYKAWLEAQRIKHKLPYGASREDIEYASGTTAL